ncbi:sensor histidine kinase [Ruminiclostridium papyrosolvens]|uniref:histidine kinase n=1 Tax=Ruminiclostridium papyrosolvens C7 TaxID=1330534 RepID=U4R699_9FIRM|nr:HAMP domain-containing sensor histidine kinase [Ruminiclostridium papyrosolvens]EPR13983.1 histidine kinase [Ruminiclostridium papyrosolvens C7]
MKGIKKREAVLIAAIYCICIAFTTYQLLVAKNIQAVIFCIIFTVLLAVMITALILLLHRYMQSVILRLSDMVASLIDMRETEVFSVLNDDLLSKLQSQVLKLSRILKSQNIKLRNEKNEIKSLISDISHQLKNPLANLKIYVSFIMDEDIDPLMRMEYLKNIDNQLDKLNWLMESMIKMTRLESGIIQLNLEENGLNDVLLTSLKQIYQKALKKNIDIVFVPSEKDIELSIDLRWTAEAITNILDNSVKYTQESGKIKIQVHKYELFARIDIEDNGAGFDEKEVNDIFKRFYRGENSNGIDGVGIGLYLTREIISMQDGYIKAKSESGKGSTFSIFLPLKSR